MNYSDQLESWNQSHVTPLKTWQEDARLAMVKATLTLNKLVKVMIGQASDGEAPSILRDSLPTFTPWEIEVYTTIHSRIVPAIFAVVIVCALVGNSAVICVIVQRKLMRTALNVFLLNLAVSDVIFAGVGLPFVTYRYAATTWSLGNALCALHNYVIMTSVYVSVYTMVAIAVFRLYYVTCRNQVTRGHKVRHGVVCVAVIWIVMLVANSPSFFLYRVVVAHEYRFCGPEYSNELFFSFLVFAYIVPLSIATICYVIVIVKLRHQNRQTPPTAVLVGGTNDSQTPIGQRAMARNVRVTRLLIAVVTAFTFCWLPMHVQLRMSHGGYKFDTLAREVFRILTFCLAYSSAIINPIIYSFVSPEFRTNFAQLIRNVACLCCRTLSRDRRSKQTLGDACQQLVAPAAASPKQVDA